MKEGEIYEYLRDNHYTGNFFGTIGLLRVKEAAISM